MPELVSDSIATPPPFPWEDHPAFRFTFLQHFTQPGDREALEHFGKMLYDSALELAGKWPAGPESPTRGELRAVLADLRHAESFIATVAGSRHVASLGLEDERLTYMVDEVSRMVGRTASILETLIGPLWKRQGRYVHGSCDRRAVHPMEAGGGSRGAPFRRYVARSGGGCLSPGPCQGWATDRLGVAPGGVHDSPDGRAGGSGTRHGVASFRDLQRQRRRPGWDKRRTLVHLPSGRIIATLRSSRQCRALAAELAPVLLRSELPDLGPVVDRHLREAK